MPRSSASRSRIAGLSQFAACCAHGEPASACAVLSNTAPIAPCATTARSFSR
jgi:hypothetical protein